MIRDSFGLDKLVLVGDRGMITTARIDALRELNDDPDTTTDFGWITALRAPDIAKLAADDGPLQMSAVRHPGPRRDHPPRLPRRAANRLPQPRCWPPNAPANATTCSPPPSTLLEPIIARVAAGRLSGADAIGVAVGKVINKHKMAKHFDYTDHRHQPGHPTPP